MKVPLTLFSLTLLALPAKAQNKQLLAAAKSVDALYDVTWSRDDKTFKADPVLARLNIEVRETQLFHAFASGDSSADIILKLREDLIAPAFPHLFLEVLDPDDNRVLFSESRDVVDEDNDVKRLIAHFLAEVSAQQSVLASEKDALKLEALLSEKQTWSSPDSHTIQIWMNGDHFYESADQSTTTNGVRLTLGTRCDTSLVNPADLGKLDRPPDTTPLFYGSCTYTYKWANASNDVLPGVEPTILLNCTVTTAEMVTSLSAGKVEGFSKKVDYAPIKRTPPVCPVASGVWTEFSYQSSSPPK